MTEFGNLDEITLDSLDKLQELCRLCLKVCENQVSMSSYAEGFQFSEMWECFVETRVVNEIHRPKYICTDCSDNLYSAYCFKINTQNAEILLNNHLLQLKECADHPNVSLPMVEEIKDVDTVELYEVDDDDHLTESFDIDEDENPQDHIIEEEDVVIEDTRLSFHLDEIVELKKFVCDVCQQTFDTKVELRRHSKNRHEKNHLCTHCGKFFKRADTLKKHILMHEGAKPFKCTVCEKAYRQSFLLKDHLRSHRKEKYICNECGKELSSYNTLNVHMKYHSGVKNYRCHLCDSNFTLSGHLKEHLKIHTDEKLFPCLICPKRFRSKGLVTIHNRTHSKERPYKCDRCPKAFPSASKLTLHIRSHTGKLSTNLIFIRKFKFF